MRKLLKRAALLNAAAMLASGSAFANDELVRL
jgi:hypothetical protein